MHVLCFYYNRFVCSKVIYKMSWADDEWKDGLPYRAIQKIQQLEKNQEKSQKESKQKQFQLDSLEAAYQKQLKKVSTVVLNCIQQLIHLIMLSPWCI